MKRLLLLLLVVSQSGCFLLNPCGGGFYFASADGRCDFGETGEPPIAYDIAVSRGSGYAGELWWASGSASSWLLDDDITLVSEIVTRNVSAVRIPQGLSDGDHQLVSDELSFNLAFVSGDSPNYDDNELDYELTPVPVNVDEVSRAIVGWSADNSEPVIIELWEGDLELTHENALLTEPNMLRDGTGYGGTTTATTVSARRISLEDGVVGPISTIDATLPSEP